MPEETTALAAGVAAKGSTVMVRPPRIGAGSRASGIELRLSTIAESPLHWTQAALTRPARTAKRTLRWHRSVRMERHTKRRRKNPMPRPARAVEKLTEMRYKGAAALADEPQQVDVDIDSAAARRAAEGARK